MEWLVLAGFCALLFGSVFLGYPLLLALLGGYALFFLYGLRRGHTARKLAALSLKEVKTVGTILLLFLFIGMVTALWRAAGTIPLLLSWAGQLISPPAFLLVSFLLCSLVSFLTGTSFGTAATVGVICMTLANSLGLSPVWAGGAILSGSFFGDRCSPMSTSALLVSAITGTDLYRNLRGMVRTAAVPFALTCLVYALAGWQTQAGSGAEVQLPPFEEAFSLHWVAVLPALVVVLFSLLRWPVRRTMALSALCAALVAVFLQGMDPRDLISTALLGYVPSVPALEGVLSGGGVISMVTPLCIVSVSSTFSGLFDGTGLLDHLKSKAARLQEVLTPVGGLTVVSVLTSLIACNQTLAILLSHTLCKEGQPPEDLALDLENTAVILAPLVPWSIAGAVPVASIGAPTRCLLAACYLYLIPLWNVGISLLRRRLAAGT
jgi:NhaC family Na+:H+ antiporter